MSEVRKWLDTIGLAQYADAFETNDLDIDLLGQVDDQLLKDIGVASAGHRLRIRNAIAKLSQQEKSVSSLCRGGCGVRVGRTPPSHGDVLRFGRLNGTVGPHGP
jgi:hypothetical protein